MKKTLEDCDIELLLPDLTDEAVTTLAFVTLHEGGERSFSFARKPGADMLLSREDINNVEISCCKVLHAGSFSLSQNPAREAIVYAMKLASEIGKLISFDVNYRSLVWQSEAEAVQEVNKIIPYVDLLKISEEELLFVGGEENILFFMEENKIAVVIETLGAAGAKYYFNNKSGRVTGRKVDAVDATGAGDAFWSGFVSRLLMDGVNRIDDLTEEKVVEAVNYGNIAGSLCVLKKGGIPALPTKREIESVK